jgi:hypothetical protein
MDKIQIISFIKAQLEQGRVTREEVIALANGANIQQPTEINGNVAVVDSRVSSSWNMVNTLYSMGAVIGIVGISILLGQHWTEIGFVGRIGVTLGIALLAYILGLLLNNSGQIMLSQTFFIISAALAPISTYVLLQRFDIVFNNLNQTYAALALIVIFGVAQYIARSNVLVLLLTGFGTWAYYSFILYMFGIFSIYDGDLLKWGTVVLGLAYILIGYGYSRKTVATPPVHILYGLGTLAALGAGISLGGNWDFVYILFIFAAFYGSIYVKSQSMLIFGALFLIGYVLKLTYRFFLDSLGWPVALIISGACIIVVGFLAFHLSRQYLKK